MSKPVEPTENAVSALKVNKAVANPWLNVKTDDYVDDNTFYQPRVSKEKKLEFYSHILRNKNKRPLPTDFTSWKSKEIANVNELFNYSSFYIFTLNFVKSQRWDHWYLNFFIIWIFLMVFFLDGWAESFMPSLVELNKSNQIVMIPLFLMCVTQAVPCFGIIYFVSHCHDLLHFMAQKDFGSWAFASIFTAQYVEYFYYRGRGLASRAGNCRYGHTPNPAPLKESILKFVRVMRGRLHAKVYTTNSDDKSGGAAEGNWFGRIKDLKSTAKTVTNGHNTNDADIKFSGVEDIEQGATLSSTENISGKKKVKEKDAQLGDKSAAALSLSDVENGVSKPESDINSSHYNDDDVDNRKTRKSKKSDANTNNGVVVGEGGGNSNSERDDDDEEGVGQNRKKRQNRPSSREGSDTDAGANGKIKEQKKPAASPSHPASKKKKTEQNTSDSETKNKNTSMGEGKKKEENKLKKIIENPAATTSDGDGDGEDAKLAGNKRKNPKKDKKEDSDVPIVSKNDDEEEEEEEEDSEQEDVARKKKKKKKKSKGGTNQKKKKREKKQTTLESNNSDDDANKNAAANGYEADLLELNAITEELNGDSVNKEQGEDVTNNVLSIHYKQKAVVIEYTDWTCMVCNTANHEPTIPPQESDICFGTKGNHYKRTFAVIKPRRRVPVCKKCTTSFDYTPPLGSAHLFPHNPKPHVAFTDYPAPPDNNHMIVAMDRTTRYAYLKAFFVGIRNDPRSPPLENDWRLRIYANNRFPEMPRTKLESHQYFEINEIVECKLQKYEWSRCRIIEVHHLNHTYNIRYDPGDELRFVPENLIRGIPEKRPYAYRVEIGMVLIAMVTPLGLGLGFMLNDFGWLLIGICFVSGILLSMRLVAFAQYFHNFYDAGLNAILRFSGLYILPLLFLFAASVLGITSSADSINWVSIVSLFIVAKTLSLVILYMMRPTFFIIGIIIFLQTSVGMILIVMQCSTLSSSPSSHHVFQYYIVPFAPFLSAALSMKLLRRIMHNIWDVSLIIRPAQDRKTENPSFLGVVMDYISDKLDIW